MTEAKLKLSTGNTQTNMQLEKRKMGIMQNEKMFAILSNGLYPDEFHAIIRELLCNAYDAVLDAGGFNALNKVKIYIHNDKLYIRDYGIGLTKEMFLDIMTVYGLSTKEFNEDAIGALGLGSKSPFAYADMFYVNSYKDGVCLQALSSVEEGEPAFNILCEVPTTERNGLEYIIPIANIDDRNKFINAVWEVVDGFDNADQIVDFRIEKRRWDDYAIDEDGDEGCYVYKLDKQELCDNKRFFCKIGCEELGGDVTVKLQTTDYHSSGLVIQMSNILYELKTHESYDYYYQQLQRILGTRTKFVIQIPNNKLTFTPCRFNLKYDRLTIERVTQVLNRAIISITRTLKRFAKANTRLSLPDRYDQTGMTQLEKYIHKATSTKNSIKFSGIRLNLEALDLRVGTRDAAKTDYERLTRSDQQRVTDFVKEVIRKNSLTSIRGYIMVNYSFPKHKKFEQFMKDGEIDDTVETVKYYDYKLGSLNYTLRDLLLQREKGGLKLHKSSSHAMPDALKLIRMVKQYDDIKLSCSVYDADDLLHKLNNKIKTEQNGKVLYPLFNSVTKSLNGKEISDVEKISVKANILSTDTGIVNYLRSDKNSDYEYFSIYEYTPRLLSDFKFNPHLPHSLLKHSTGLRLHNSKKIIIIPTLVDQVKIHKNKAKEIRDLVKAQRNINGSWSRETKNSIETEVRIYNVFIQNVIRLHHQNATVMTCNGRDKRNLIEYLEDQYPNKEIQVIELTDFLSTKSLKQTLAIMRQQALAMSLASLAPGHMTMTYLRDPEVLARVMHNLNVSPENEEIVRSKMLTIADIIYKNTRAAMLQSTNNGIVDDMRKGTYPDTDRLKQIMHLRQRVSIKMNKYISSCSFYNYDKKRNIVSSLFIEDEYKQQIRNQVRTLLMDIEKVLFKQFNIIERRFLRDEWSILSGVSCHSLEAKVKVNKTNYWYPSNEKRDDGSIKPISVIREKHLPEWKPERIKTNMILRTIVGKSTKHYTNYEQSLISSIDSVK